MKPVVSLVVLLAWRAALPAQTAFPGLRLAGIVNVPPLEKSVIIVSQSTRGLPRNAVELHERERYEEVEILRIHPERGAVEVRVYSSERPIRPGSSATNLLLSMPVESNAVATPPPPLWLNGAPDSTALYLYSQFANRTILRHPLLRTSTINLRLLVTNPAEAATALAQALASNNVAVILDGEKFVMAVPRSYADLVHPRSSAIKPAARPAGEAEASFSAGTMRLSGAQLRVMARFYAELLGRTIVDTDWFRPISVIPVFFVNQTPLNRTEMLYAFETILEWNGVRLESEGDLLIKPVPLGSK